MPSFKLKKKFIPKFIVSKYILDSSRELKQKHNTVKRSLIFKGRALFGKKYNSKDIGYKFWLWSHLS